ncbi:glycosyltransferase [Actinomycetospora straminea]|uniref:Glycosyltransferase n=1 Tax=Actinomycetospora straminea TaxID=663607 RepID=A0ABP9DZ19_9PSEU|nr:glycosyltransferase [Actinomycetospora straminea]MDD7931033.1 glycosyltransferase [Actinomycetospora straminea]
MKVLHVITGLAAGGAEQQLRLLCAHSGVQCEVAVLTNPGLVAEAIAAGGTPVVDIGMRSNRDIRALGRLVRLMRSGRYDCVHTHLFRAGLFGRLAARIARVPRVVATEHSLGASHIEGRPVSRRGIRTLYRFGESLGDRTIAVSRHTADIMLSWGIPASKVTVVPNGIDSAELRFSARRRAEVRAELGIGPATPLVAGCGRLVSGKRFEVLLEAVAKYRTHEALLIGSGPAEGELRRAAGELGIADRVHFTGEVSDVPGLLSAADVLASPSAEETYGLAIIEALACGLPVVYAACPALEERADALGPWARRTEPTAERFAEAIDDVLAVRGPLATASSRTAWPVVDVYDIRRLVSQIESLYSLTGEANR